MKELRAGAILAYPDFSSFIECKEQSALSVWEGELRNGKALEFLSLLSLMSVISESYSNCEIPHALFSNPELFYLRNEIPQHHLAQAGHSAAVNGSIDLEDRFVSSLVPRMTFCSRGKSYMIFREGNPLHLIYSEIALDKTYSERPDIIIVEGQIQDIQIANRRLSLNHITGGEQALIELSIRNTNILPVERYEKSANYSVKTLGVIECSVHKIRKHVDNQFTKYQKIFQSDSFIPECLFIHGDKGKSIETTVHVDMNDLICSVSSDNILQELKLFLSKSLS